MRRVETGSLVAALGAALLLVSLFLQWFEPDLSAWDAFEVWDLVLAAIALAVLAVAAGELGLWHGPLPVVEILLAGSCALVIVAAALINHPPAAIGRGVKDGAWLGLGGALLMVAGGLMARAGFSLSFSVGSTAARPPGQARARPGPSGPPPGAAPVPGRAGPARVPGAAPAPAPAPAAPPRQPARRGRAPGARAAEPDLFPGPGRASGALPADPDLPPGAGARGVRPRPAPAAPDETDVTQLLPEDPDRGPPPRR